jgi:hypothetical protein
MITGKQLLALGAWSALVNYVTFSLPWAHNVSIFDVTYGNWVALAMVYLIKEGK